MMRGLAGIAFLAGAAVCAELGAAQQHAREKPPLFRITTDDFWLNLHQYLYVLGRAEAKMPDATRRAVAGAPEDQAKRLSALSSVERTSWVEAVRFYADGVSRQDAVFDRRLIDIGNALARAGSRESVNDVELEAGLKSTLERVAPTYRKGWWSAHRDSNERWKSAIDPVLSRDGDALVAFVTRAYGMTWPRDGYPVRVVVYANWAGAFSTTGPLLMISSFDSGNIGMHAVETIIHESMHQWDDEMWELLRAQAKAQGTLISGELTHAMIWLTAGEAIRSRIPDHEPYAVANGMWTRSLGRFKPALDAAWLPWLRGKGTRDAAIAELIKLVPEVPKR
jgi:hypothetical protein